MMKRLLLCLTSLLFALPLCIGQDLDIYSTDKVHEIKLLFEQEDWSQKLHQLKAEGNDDRLLGKVIIDGQSYDNVGIRYKGNSSYNFIKQTGSSKLPFNIKLNYVDKDQKLPGGVKTLKLANGFRDPSFIRETLAYDIARQYMPASRATFAKVYANDEYLGVYTLVESVDNAFLDRYFGEHKGTFIKCDPNYSYEAPAGCPEGDRASLMYLGQDSTCYLGYYEMQSDEGWADLIQLTKALESDLENIEQYINVDEVLWMLAFDNYLVNLDSYIGAFCHNYYLYKDTLGVFHPIVWDMNMAFGGFRLPDVKTSYSDEQLKKTSMLLHFKSNVKERPLLTNLLRKELYRKVYLAHIKTLVEDQGLDSSMYTRAEELIQVVEADVLADKNKFYSDDAFKGSLTTTQMASQERIIGIFDLMDGRNQYLNNHQVLKREAPAIESVDHELADDKILVSTNIKNAQAAWLCYRNENSINFKRKALTKGEADESGAGHNWSAEIEHVAGTQYYIIAEGQYNASLSPRRASFEFHSVE